MSEDKISLYFKILNNHEARDSVGCKPRVRGGPGRAFPTLPMSRLLPFTSGRSMGGSSLTKGSFVVDGRAPYAEIEYVRVPSSLVETCRDKPGSPFCYGKE